MKVNLDQICRSVTWGAMHISRSIFSLFFATSLLLPTQAAFAQDNLGPTPRESLVEFIKSGEWAEPDSKNEVKSERPKPETSSFEASIFPYYLTAADYLAARETVEGPALKLSYSVVKEDLKLNLPLLPSVTTLQIGTDYAAIKRNESTTIYDFRTRRKLSLRGGDKPVFTSQALFADALKDVSFVNKNTKKGQLSAVPLSKDKTLDAFWLESGVGWTARDISESIEIDQSDDQIQVSYESQPVLDVALTGPNISNPDILRSLIGLWHQSWPIHPAILARLEAFESAPETIQTLSFSPSEINGVRTTWTLKSSDQGDMAFPLTADVPNLVHTPEASPLAFVISQAADDKALGGRPSLDNLRDLIFKASQKGDWLGAWQAAQTLSGRQGGCENDPAILCDDIKLIEEKADAGSVFFQILKGRAAKSADERLAALLELYPATEAGDAPASALKTAGILRSTLKTSLSDKLRPISAGRLLEKALVKAPYDPEIYLTLSQVYAAQGRYVESWDILDALRTMPDIDPSYFKSVDQVEKSLLARAPGYFGPQNR